ncbi:MAG: arginase family protein, partial [Anaerolineae bacterium]|nr:arginase family protein [Anaerolineae bacterium]
HPGRFHEMAHQPFGNSAVYMAYLRDKGVVVHSLLELRLRGLAPAFCNILDESHAKAIFWGFDIDVVCAADAPGVSAPNPLGMTGDELCQLARLAGEDRRTRIIEIAEVNPAFDIDNRTCRLAAVAVFFYLTGLMLDKE